MTNIVLVWLSQKVNSPKKRTVEMQTVIEAEYLTNH